MVKKGKKSASLDDDEEMYQQAPAEELGAPSDSPALENEEPAADDFLNTIRSSKKKKEDKEQEVKDKKEFTVLTKKQKEKLKKEAEKLAKKEAAVKKKAEMAAKKEQIKEANKKHAAESADRREMSVTPESAPAAGDETKADEPKTDAAKPAVKKGKKVPAGLAALKRQIELRKQLEEQQRLEEEAEEQRRQEEEAQEEAQEAALEAQKEQERLEKEKLRAEGKYLTKRQRAEKEAQERRRELFLQSANVSVAGLAKKAGDGDKPAPEGRKKVVYSKKKSTKPKAFEQKQTHQKVAEEKKAAAAEEVVDDWEALLDVEDQIEESAAVEEQPAVESSAASEQSEDKEGAAAAEAAKAAEAARQQAEKARKEELAREAALAEDAAKKTPVFSDKELRSPICCILGHVDTGKTKLLDKIRQTNVQGGEAGGITQQIGATYFPVDAIRQKTAVMSKYERISYEVPGLLIIDTPGHESFSNLRSRGSSLCNIAILVIDIMHGLEPQTLESLRLLRDRKAPFVVALNKIDRLYDWNSTPMESFRGSYTQQSKSVQDEFNMRYQQIKLALAEQGLNSELYFQNKNMSKYVSIVPTSAVTGEGVPDLLWLLLELTQKRMSKQLMYLSKVEATILEVKVVEGFAYTIDVLLSNGILREGDRIVLCGLNGPIATNIRALLTPPPSRELRVKSEYVHHKEVKAALGVKIAANDLEKAVAGSRLLVVGPDDDEDDLMEEVMDDLTGLLDSVDSSGRGVVVQASTLGSLEALLDFLKAMKISVMSIGLGPVYKRDVMKATTMLEKAPELAIMLCFDVKVDREAEQYAEEQHIKIFNADIIYHLFDQFTAYQEKLLEQRRKDFLEYAVMPCVLKTIQIINKCNPMIIGVDVVEGSVRCGTPICAVRRDPDSLEPRVLVLGRVTSLEVNHKSVDLVKKGQTAAGVAMRLENPSSAQPTWGRHVDESDNLYSLISRKSIDTLKDPAFRDTVSREDWFLIKKLKQVFDIK